MPFDAANLSNTHIVDQYADVLDQIKALNKIKADLAKQISAQIKDGNALPIPHSPSWIERDTFPVKQRKT